MHVTCITIITHTGNTNLGLFQIMDLLNQYHIALPALRVVSDPASKPLNIYLSLPLSEPEFYTIILIILIVDYILIHYCCHCLNLDFI